MTSCCSSDRWIVQPSSDSATLCLFFAGCTQDAVITDVTEHWSICTWDDGGVTSRSECPPSSCSCSKWEDEESASDSVSRGTDLLPIFLPTVFTGAFLPPLGGMVRIRMKILSNRDEGAERSRKEQEGAAARAAEVLQSAISNQQEVFFLCRCRIRNWLYPDKSGTIRGSSTEARPATSVAHPGWTLAVRGSSGVFWDSTGAIWGSAGANRDLSGKSGAPAAQSVAHSAQSDQSWGCPGLQAQITPG